jgi:hypothetical protein
MPAERSTSWAGRSVVEDHAMLTRVISSGQTGADQAGLRAARAAGIPTGGWAPKGWLTEKGPSLWLADFGLVECPEPGYPPRTRANVRDSDGSIWFGDVPEVTRLSKPF